MAQGGRSLPRYAEIGLLRDRIWQVLNDKVGRSGPAKNLRDRNAATFEITLPPGYVVDDLPPAANADYPFASYHSKTEVNGNVLRYTRSMEVKHLAVPLDKLADLKRFYQITNGYERNTAVLKPAVAK